MIGYDVGCPSYCSWARVGRCVPQLGSWARVRWTRHALWHIAVFLLLGTNSASNLVRTAGRRDLFLPPFGCAACCARTPITNDDWMRRCESQLPRWARVGRCASQLMQLGPRRVPPARLPAPRGSPSPWGRLCVELCSDHWSTGLVPSALWLCGVLRAGTKKKR
jgi:hypothetical protein